MSNSVVPFPNMKALKVHCCHLNSHVWLCSGMGEGVERDVGQVALSPDCPPEPKSWDKSQLVILVMLSLTLHNHPVRCGLSDPNLQMRGRRLGKEMEVVSSTAETRTQIRLTLSPVLSHSAGPVCHDQHTL